MRITTMSGSQDRRWVIQSEVDSFTFRVFAECMADIAESAKLFNEQCRQGQFRTHSFNKTARDISVAFRKVMLDGNGYLFKACVEPRLHPLKDPRSRPQEGTSFGCAR